MKKLIKSDIHPQAVRDAVRTGVVRRRPKSLPGVPWALELGSRPDERGGVSFAVWAPRCDRVEIKLLKNGRVKFFLMQRDSQGYFRMRIPTAVPGDRYFYHLDRKDDRPDPASRYQPEGVHGPSQIIDPRSFRWSDSGWKGIPYPGLIFYELHVGTFTRAGTFDAAIRKIPYLKKLGITCVELMPVAQFPGKRNWGYDGVGLYAVQNSYGGPDALKRFVNACHRAGLAVCLDVVYNHLGPEGNYLHGYGPYFTAKYHTPWGDALNYDDEGNGGVRRFIIDNALYWITEYRIDVLRLDAIHGIFDESKEHILSALNEKVRRQARRLGRTAHVVAESDLNDSRVIRPRTQKGFGLAGQWSDDFHHAVHAYLTGERGGYYSDFGKLQDVAKAIRDGFVYDGRYSAFRKRDHGNPVRDLHPQKLVVCVQNHDQVGNRAFGGRLAALTDFRGQKLAAALLLFSPNTPLIFMGQEYGERAPFQYFISHGDQALVRAIRMGRKKEFESFGWRSIPDPAAENTFRRSKLRWKTLSTPKHASLLKLYRVLIHLRRRWLTDDVQFETVSCDAKNRWLAWEFSRGGRPYAGAVISFSDRGQSIALPFGFRSFQTILSTEDPRFGGTQTVSGEPSSGRLRLPARSAWLGRCRHGVDLHHYA
jgi:maltooligosyltrehalose trehalohydrolase